MPKHTSNTITKKTIIFAQMDTYYPIKTVIKKIRKFTTLINAKIAQPKINVPQIQIIE